MTTLPQKSLDVIKQYESLKFGDNAVCTPYFNNKRQKVRGALRVLVGKGTPTDIVEEAKLMARREHVDMSAMSAEKITKFLVDHNLGVDCSGFVYHVLGADGALKSKLKFPNTSLLRKLLVKLRPAENTNVKVLAHEKNSEEVSLSHVQAGDFIAMIGSNKVGNPDHILLIEQVNGSTLTYVHSYKLPSDGMYDHGIKRGAVEVTSPSKSITEQHWGDDEVLALLKDAATVSLRRLKQL